MIISTGMRTDIPAFYTTWFLNRLKAGFVMARNPYNQQHVTCYKLNPDVVDIITFCTKNPAPMLRHMDALDGYGQYWHVTITPYGSDIEPNVPPKKEVMESFKELSGRVGINNVCWRFDPILITDGYPIERLLNDFESMAETLSGYTRICIVSFIDLYPKVRQNFPGVRTLNHDERIRTGIELVRIASRYGITVRPCAEGRELEPYGADCGGCVTVADYERAVGCRLNIPATAKSSRPECGCCLGTDIGNYSSCAHLCRYCYANSDAKSVRRNITCHDPASPFLIGNSIPGDEVYYPKQKSWKERQLRLF